MNVPAVAQRTFEESRDNPDLISIVNLTLEALQKLHTPEQRTELVHTMINEFNADVFAHPLVVQFSPCKKGCDGCCHTQVSVTEDEAIILSKRIVEGIQIDEDLLKKQMATKDNSTEFFKLNYADRRCIFLDQDGACRVYADRPSVCRTNAVLGSASQCDTSVKLQPVRLVKTPQSDMIIYAQFLYSNKNGSLSKMIGELIAVEES
jgi:Fe-S-cluster containining protein